MSLVFPAHNEKENIRHAVDESVAFMGTLDCDYEIIIVNDGSTDGTARIVDELASQNQHVRAIHHEQNKGYGTALKNGFAAAKYELIFFTDSDRQFSIESLGELLPLIKAADIAIGYRLDRKDPLLRRFLSWGYNTLAGFIFDLNVKDIDCAFKLFRREVFSKINIESKQFFVNTEILAKARFYHFRIAEMGVEHYPRTCGESTVSLKYIPLTLRELWRINKSLNALKAARDR